MRMGGLLLRAGLRVASWARTKNKIANDSRVFGDVIEVYSSSRSACTNGSSASGRISERPSLYLYGSSSAASVTAVAHILEAVFGRVVYFQPVTSPNDPRVEFFHSTLTKNGQQQTAFAGVMLDEAKRALVGKTSDTEELFEQLSCIFEEREKVDSTGLDYHEDDSHSMKGAVVMEGNMNLSAANNAKIASEMGASMVIVKNDTFADERLLTNTLQVAEEYSGDHSSTSPDQMRQDAESLALSIALERDVLVDAGARVAGTFVNRVRPGFLEHLSAALEKREVKLLGHLPRDEVLAASRLNEISKEISAETLYCPPISNMEQGEVNPRMDVPVSEVVVATVQISDLLTHLEGLQSKGTAKEGGFLIVTSADRPDILLGLIAGQFSRNVPPIAGILLTGGHRPGQPVQKLINGILDRGTDSTGLESNTHSSSGAYNPAQFLLPVLLTREDTFRTVQKLNKVRGPLMVSSKRKIDQIKLLAEQHVDPSVFQSVLREGMDSLDSNVKYIHPRIFRQNMVRGAATNLKRIVLPEDKSTTIFIGKYEDMNHVIYGWTGEIDLRILQAAAKVAQRKRAVPVLLGNKENILMNAEKLQISLAGVDIEDPASSDKVSEYATIVHERQKHRGLTYEDAMDIVSSDVNAYGCAMVASGEADGMVSGARHTTADVVRRALQIVRPRSGQVSSVFFMLLPSKVLIYGDCAINTDPNAEQLALIAQDSARTAMKFGIQPRVALLSYATGDSNTGPLIEKVKNATAMARKAMPNTPFEGPIQYDAAVDPRIASVKYKGAPNEVAGCANILIFPDLNTGNNTYKAVQQATGAIAMGPLLQGLNKPVNDLSRGCTVDDVENTIVMTALQAIGEYN